MGQQIIYNNLEVSGTLTVSGTQVIGGGGGGISNTAAISGGNAAGLTNEIGSYAINTIGSNASNYIGLGVEAVNQIGSNASNYIGLGSGAVNQIGNQASNNYIGLGDGTVNEIGSNANNKIGQSATNYIGQWGTNYIGQSGSNIFGRNATYNRFGQDSVSNRYYSGSGIGQFDFDTRLKVNGSGIALSGEVLPITSGVNYITTGNNFVFATKANEASTVSASYTGSTSLNINNLPTGHWLFKVYEVYSGLSSTVGARSFITGSGILYSINASVSTQTSATLAGATLNTGYLSNSTGVYDLPAIRSTITREGIANVTGSSSKLQIAFSQLTANATPTYLLSGSYMQIIKTL
jgi:hypothetical protein